MRRDHAPVGGRSGCSPGDVVVTCHACSDLQQLGRKNNSPGAVQPSLPSFPATCSTDRPQPVALVTISRALSAFARAGGKLLRWHGQADQLVPTQGTVDYRERVNRVSGGNRRVDDFYRLFLLPGVAHCGGGPGPQPTGELDALVNWVEKGQAPATLATSSADGSVTRNACRYPQVARFTGHGDPKAAANYRCVPA
ncbi:tannase/feruloyl esterase family alpha/beta hydrolase [Micromonospora sp. NPDC047187]|uniref:tannase/feruloyl esterase family alpha/beta hydrolase n=1 Tax=Micromonospora sp. NPDC047187 TaxID=3155262 RepID=UPI0033C1AD83